MPPRPAHAARHRSAPPECDETHFDTDAGDRLRITGTQANIEAAPDSTEASTTAGASRPKTAP
ncbi:MAG TPA: hypothetical protein VF342_00300 [Alphaproteobacteria bacterium]